MPDDPLSDADERAVQLMVGRIVGKPKMTTFVDSCYYSKTGFALWERDELGRTYCTCVPRKAPVTHKEP